MIRFRYDEKYGQSSLFFFQSDLPKNIVTSLHEKTWHLKTFKRFLEQRERNS